MKRWIALAVAVCLLLPLAGCGGAKKPNPIPEPPGGNGGKPETGWNKPASEKVDFKDVVSMRLGGLMKESMKMTEQHTKMLCIE